MGSSILAFKLCIDEGQVRTEEGQDNYLCIIAYNNYVQYELPNLNETCMKVIMDSVIIMDSVVVMWTLLLLWTLLLVLWNLLFELCFSVFLFLLLLWWAVRVVLNICKKAAEPMIFHPHWVRNKYLKLANLTDTFQKQVSDYYI